MAQVDSIIVIDQGRVVDIGTPADLSKKGTPHIRGLSTWPSGDIIDEGIRRETAPSPGESISRGQSLAQEPSTEQPIEDANAGGSASNDGKLTDIRRKNGEFSVYSYYLVSSGYVSVGLYAFTMATWIFCTEFSSRWLWALGILAFPRSIKMSC